MKESSFDYVIVGAGSAGISVASRLKKKFPDQSVAIIDPSEQHYYQPLWTLVGAGQTTKESTGREIKGLIPRGVQWIKDKVDTFNPEENSVALKNEGRSLTYKYLIVAPGIQLDWGKIGGIEGKMGSNGLCSNYDFNYVNSTWENLNNFKGGRAIFTMPPMPIKCPGAPQKIMWLAEDLFTRKGIRDKCEVIFVSATPNIFGVEKYRNALNKLLEERNIKTYFSTNLESVDAENKKATFKDLKSGDTLDLDYDMLHLVPPQSAPDFIKSSPLSNEGGWVDVDKHTLQHQKYSNIFSLGDSISAPCSKTGAAIRKQAPVVTENLASLARDLDLKAKYDGYASCPLVTRHNKCILAEFGYDGKIMETFPFDQSKERWSMYILKRYLLPKLYWNFMLKGTM